ncbi:MAG: hypothetical protein GY810_15940 [Aureispira sp.]|nr:hypothetical protein [Aureispira sp.]
MSKYIFRLSLFFLSFGIHAQKDLPISKNILYVEGLGIGGFGSINYERILFDIPQHKISLSGRLGVGTYNFLDYNHHFNPDLIFPIGIYAFYGKTHHAELGIGYILSTIVQASRSLQPIRKANTHLSFSIGYRYQKNSKGLFIGLRYSPIIEFYKHFKHWGAAYVGYCF